MVLDCFVYIVTTTHNAALYVGVTTQLPARLVQHRQKVGSVFTAKYHTWKLVYYEQTPYLLAAIAREKQIKRMSRARKIKLISAFNPSWRDLGEDVLGQKWTGYTKRSGH